MAAQAPHSDTVGTATAARILGVSESRIRQMANAGDLRVVSTPLGRLFDRAEIEALAARRQAAAEAQ